MVNEPLAALRAFFLRLLRRITFLIDSKKILDYDNYDLQLAVFEIDRSLSDWSIADPDNLCKFESALLESPSPSILDFGGGLGRHSRGLPTGTQENWRVIEVPSLVKIAKSQDHGFEGKMFDNLDDGLGDVGSSEWIFHASNSLQYAEFGLQTLERVVSHRPSIVLLENLLVHDCDKDLSFYQYSFLGDNLPSRRLGNFSFRGARYMVRPLSETKVAEILETNYSCRRLERQSPGSFFPAKYRLALLSGLFTLKANV